jgi:hypothetical protein
MLNIAGQLVLQGNNPVYFVSFKSPFKGLGLLLRPSTRQPVPQIASVYG